MQVSVIIPTHNRQPTLARTLEHLSLQDQPAEEFEVIVVDDGSTDGTWSWLKDRGKGYPYRLHALRQRARGPAAARNRGLEVAQGELVIFLGDDICASAGLLSRHLAWHSAYPDGATAVVGHVQWAPDLPVTSLMAWMEIGVQWRFDRLESGEVVDYHWFITANLSLQRSVLLEAGGFDEGFPDAAMEDMELGYRLCRRGLQIRYAPDALAYHWHPTRLEAMLARSRKVGQAAIYFAGLWPELRDELLDPATWFADRPPIQRQILSHAVQWRWFIAALLPVAGQLAQRPPGWIQPLTYPLYWLVALHYRLRGSELV